MIKWLRPWLGCENHPADQAEAVRRDAERRLNEVRNRWPEVREARSTLATWVEDGLRRKA